MAVQHVLGLCLVLATLCAAWVYTDCGSGGAKIRGVSVRPCIFSDVNDDGDVCVMHPRMTYTIRAIFTARQDFTDMTAKVSFHFVGKSYQFPEAKLCDKIKCPVLAGEKRDLKMTISSAPSYPKTPMQVRWEVLDEKKRGIFCVMIPFKIE